jgi:hypothetical protein
MKKSMFLVALLAIPAVAFAGTATMALKMSDGSTSVTVAPGVATNLAVVWTLDAYNDTAEGGYGIANVDAYITASTGNAFKITAGAWGLPFSNGNFGGGVTGTLNPLSPQLGGLAANPAFDDPGGFGNYAAPGNGALPWTLRTLTIQLQSGFAIANTVYTLTIPGAFAGTNDSGGLPITLDTTNNGGITVTVTPEPATMLLLAAAVPFLRRRSA